jgi:luxR family transcriptional regulator, regulator of transport and utilization of aryl beta-glucosides
MEKRSSGRHVAIVDNCAMTEIGLRQLFRHSTGISCQISAYKNSQQWFEQVVHPQYDVVIYAVAENRYSRQECMSFFTHLFKTHSRALRVLLAEDDRQAALIQHLSAVPLNAVLCKSTPVRKLKAQIQVLLSHNGLPESLLSVQKPSQSFELSPTERVILDYMSKGHSISEIALHMERTAKTIRTHKFNVMNKLRVSTDSGLLCAADILRFQPEAGLR